MKTDQDLLDSKSSMSINQIIQKIILLPKILYESNSKSIHFLLKETGYFENHNIIKICDIKECIINRPEIIDAWIQYSEDKRTSSGWFFKKEGSQKYVVAYLTKDRVRTLKRAFNDSLEACAIFIKNEIEEIRMH